MGGSGTSEICGSAVGDRLGIVTHMHGLEPSRTSGNAFDMTIDDVPLRVLGLEGIVAGGLVAHPAPATPLRVKRRGRRRGQVEASLAFRGAAPPPGTSTQKVLPAPSWLSTPMRPPLASAMLLASANPSPTPP
jgi:hypothetical protein